MATSFRKLKVWERSIELTVLVYSLTGDFPKAEIYGLSSQMKRAAVSIASNIAEGSGRRTKKDFRQFVAIAHGSNCELQTQIVIARKLGYGTLQKLDETESFSVEVGKMLAGLSKYLTTSSGSLPNN